MSIKSTVSKQYRAIINEAAIAPLQHVANPKEGWISTVRKALDMSAAQLGRIIGKTRANVSAAERSELDERATFKTLKTLAEAMGCKLVYAIIPHEGSIEDLIRKQAHKKAVALVEQANTHMALEEQSLSEEKIKEEIDRLTLEIINKNPSDFWEDA